VVCEKSFVILIFPDHVHSIQEGS
jgi:hypothetical protein